MFNIKKHKCAWLFSSLFLVCTEPSFPTNGMASTSGLLVNASLQYMCFSGYKVSGPSLGWCLANGSWSIAAPSCILGKKHVLLVPNFVMLAYAVDFYHT